MDRFNICQAYAQLEADYNVGGWLRERPSNQRRREACSVQLRRIGFSNPYGWVDIELIESGDGWECDEVREVYMKAVLRLDLPIDEGLMTAMHNFFTADFLSAYPQTQLKDFKQ